MNTNSIHSTSALDNQEPASELDMDTSSSTDKIAAVANQELIQNFDALTIPITQSPFIANQELIQNFDALTIPITQSPFIAKQEQALELSISKIPTIKLPAIARISTPSGQKPQGLQLLIIWLLITLLLFAIVSTHMLALPQPTRQHSQDMSSQPTTQQPTITTAITPTNTSSQDAQQVTDLGKQYMSALLNQRYNIMWSLMHPQSQAMWPNETRFIHFWQMRFQGFTLQNFTLGQAHRLSFWVNPETMRRYNQVEALPISLQLSAQVPADKVSLLPTLDQKPSETLQNLPLIAVRATLRTDHEMAEQWLILNGGPADLETPILPPLTPVRRTINLPILMYHHITDAPTYNLLDFSLTITPNVFSQQMDYLKVHGYHTITFNQLFDFLYYNGPLPSKPIILSFDDGYEDAYKFAYPILKEHDYSGIFYIITGKVGWKEQATWDQLREMLANGMQMGSHTITHRNIGEVWRYSQAIAQQELQQSQQNMQIQLGMAIQQFCYPTGEPFHHENAIVQQAIMTLLEQDGYIGATTDPPPVGITQDSQKPFILLRVRVDGRESLQAFSRTIP